MSSPDSEQPKAGAPDSNLIQDQETRFEQFLTEKGGPNRIRSIEIEEWIAKKKKEGHKQSSPK
jgi:hypothetical protein